MIISSRTECGLRALAEIARSPGVPVKRAEIAERQRIPLPFLTQILQILISGEFVVSIRGPRGGYVLARPAEDTSLLEVVNLLQGPMVPRACVDDGRSESCGKSGDCILMAVWRELRDAGESVLKKTTLKDISIGRKHDALLGLAGG